MQIICTGLRKKRIAPPPPTPRPLSSAISTQALERIVDSEESLTSDMDPSKSPSDIGAPSKASSDIDCPKANSDIVISTKSTLELDYEPKLEVATYEFDDNIEQNRTAKTNVKACSETDSVNYKLVKTDVEMITPVEVPPKVEQARVVTKKGKLVRIISSSNALLRSFKTRNSSRSPYQISKNMSVNNETSHVTLYPRKYRFSILKRDRLHTQRYRSQYDNFRDTNFVNDVSLGIVTKDHIQNVIGQMSQESQSLKRIPSLYENHEEVFFDSHKFFANRSNKLICYAKRSTKEYDDSYKHLRIMQTSMNLEGIKDVKNMECEILESPWNNSLEQYAKNLSPLLSTLQIFAISTKPLEIQMSTNSIPSDIDELPSLPIINYTENKLKEKKLSILQPPPPGLVNRQESNENWNCFLVQLNSILESRVGEFV